MIEMLEILNTVDVIENIAIVVVPSMIVFLAIAINIKSNKKGG